jgi:hypothetical protein
MTKWNLLQYCSGDYSQCTKARKIKDKDCKGKSSETMFSNDMIVNCKILLSPNKIPSKSI